MKKKIDFSKPGGFPFTQATLDFMQEAYKSILQTLIGYLGVPATGHYIISGVETSGTHLTAGWVVVNGEVLPFKQSTKGAKIVVKESKRAVAFKNATSQDVYIDRWAEASQTQGTALAGFTRIKQPSDFLEKQDAATFLGVRAKAADSDKLDGKHAADFLLKTAKATDSDKLDGKHAADFLLKTAKATDSDKLDGKQAADFLLKTAKATDSDKLDGKHAADFLLKSALSNSIYLNDSSKVATSSAVKALNDKLPSWASTLNKEGFLEVICAGRVTKSGARADWHGKSRVSGFPFSVQKLSGNGEYKITHNFGNSTYGLVGNGTIGNYTTNDRGYNMFVSIKYRNSNDCTVIVGNDSAPDNAAFSFILFNLT